MPLKNDAKRLTNGQFTDPHQTGGKSWGMTYDFFVKKKENSNMPKIKDKTPNKWAI